MSIDNGWYVYTGDPLLAPAWAAFVQWAFNQPDLRADFEQSTATPPLTAPRTPLDAMIDDATGRTDSYLNEFIGWVTATMWDGVPG